jgi:major membrane immunogen (membrane-anchored lipoprotein)
VKTARALMVLMALFVLVGCSSSGGSAGLGALGGAAAGAGGYEYHLKRQEDKVEQDYKDGKITKSEYDIRIDQIKKDSVFR